MLSTRLSLASLLALLLASPADAGKVTGLLLSDGVPVAGAVVTAVPHEGPTEEARRAARFAPPPKPLATATSGPDGAFSLVVQAASREFWFRVRVEAKGLVPVDLPGAFEAAETEDAGELALVKGAPLAGRVLGPDGAPVADDTPKEDEP